jgi:polyhydroxybutyrate depolymerase
MIKLYTIIIIFTYSINLVYSQWSNKNFSFDGINRQYRIYIPLNYNSSNPPSLVMTLHGMGDNITNFSMIGMNYVADTANVIVIVPQALSDPNAGTTWNSGAGYMGYFPNSGTNDVGFLNALLDTVQSDYVINQERVYCCGFSMGGFMTQRLACELANRFTAVASVAGTIGQNISTCNSSKVIPVAHFHGTSDGTVPYTNNNLGIDVDSLVKIWINRDICSTTPSQTTYPDIAADGYTIDHFIYPDGEQGTEVELFKVNGANHVWLTYGNDINYTVEIWKFFNKHKSMISAGNKEPYFEDNYEIFPNPVTESMIIKSNQYNTSYFEIIDMNGKTLSTGKFMLETTIATSEFKSGIYILSIKSENGYYKKQKIVVN